MTDNTNGSDDDRSVHSGMAAASASRHDSAGDDSSTNTPLSQSFSGSSTTGTSYTGRSTNNNNAIPEDIIASKETRAINFSRFLVLAVILISAVVAGVLTYILTTDAEQQSFQVQVRVTKTLQCCCSGLVFACSCFCFCFALMTSKVSPRTPKLISFSSSLCVFQSSSSLPSSHSTFHIRNNNLQFQDYAEQIEDVSLHNSRSVYLVLDSLAVTISSYAMKTNSTWPNVTIPNWEIRGENFRDVTGAQLVSISPIVTNVDQWNEYANANAGWWIQESYDERDDEGQVLESQDFPPQMYYHTSTSADDRYWDNEPEVQVEGITYSPLWQESTVPNDVRALNYNMLSHDIFAKNWRIMKGSKSPVLSEVFDPSELLGAEAVKDYGDGIFHPESLLVQPIFRHPTSDAANTSDIVGSIVAVLPWDTYFTNLLHDGANGIIVTMSDTCGDDFSYRLDGPHATYLGSGDYHDDKYAHMEHIVPFGPPDSEYVYEDNDDAEAHCLYSLHVYPSSELEESYTTNRPIIFTVVVVLIFLFTSFVFVCYDYMVQRRQEKVQSAAVKSNAIVSSLFPADVRDRLFQHAMESDPKSSKAYSSKNKDGAEPGAKFRLKTYLNDTDDHNGKDNDGDDGANNQNEKDIDMTAIPEMYETKPIADLFPNATVLFADIAGFTAWSSVREPSQVFTLLETVYKAFDTIAKRRRVFKVETVGDCYVVSFFIRSS
jgi:Adenylate and Guanylate cyclase catalytic domain